jgi:hypothetical protein
MANFKTPKIRKIGITTYKILGITTGSPKYAIAKYKINNGPWIGLIDFEQRKLLASFLRKEAEIKREEKKFKK